jgi:hypothetical protein
VERARQEQGINRDGKREKGGLNNKIFRLHEREKETMKAGKKHRGEEIYSQSN